MVHPCQRWIGPPPSKPGRIPSTSPQTVPRLGLLLGALAQPSLVRDEGPWMVSIRSATPGYQQRVSKGNSLFISVWQCQQNYTCSSIEKDALIIALFWYLYLSINTFYYKLLIITFVVIYYICIEVLFILVQASVPIKCFPSSQKDVHRSLLMNRPISYWYRRWLCTGMSTWDRSGRQNLHGLSSVAPMLLTLGAASWNQQLIDV